MEDKLEEEWKDIENYPNYQISNLGRVNCVNGYSKTAGGFIGNH